MRWSMLPVSVAVHAVAVLAFLIIPLAADVELPAFWPTGRQQFIAAAPAPPPAPTRRSPSAAVPDRAAPIVAPETIANDPVEPVGSDDPGALPAGEPAVTGMPSGFGSGTVPAPPVPQPPPPPPPTVVRAGVGVRVPTKLVHVDAVYPEIARQARVEGRVIVEATLDERGYVTGARVLRSIPLLDAAALAAVKQWRYTPTLLNNVPVRVLMTVTFDFTLGRTP